MLCPDLNPTAIERRLKRLNESHVRPLNDWIRSLRSDHRLPAGAGTTVPWFDPDSGGVNSRVLLLLQDPSRVATTTRFISPDNNDQTARYTTEACAAAGLQREIRLHWNVFPWWVNVIGSSGSRGLPDPDRIAETWTTAEPLAATLTAELLALLPKLSTIVVAGKNTQKVWNRVGVRTTSDIEVLLCPSLSPLGGFHRHRSEAIDILARAGRGGD